ncbi:flagellar biosynthetic protein FlhB [Gluconacetobacter johannae DSM 13595]|uniref:EscU/YscU/HrcU family type III secretion system export apparatus switch protein n=1 Tax=Gluconacetobacter johannae TaxID=112140 RepID=A0A7W4P4R4_9PROT|nr:EscU/YscU/HrcU family type III secretion system export apparatus switch protein [Gluconacetobacter johannae]MBB2177312.1 EscU/YscU/HrcU family type III secretion system export apparatus switch protein [Gluconacetobacter johannae]GBQ82625.1 flagellar biosynthetic protein FlhB [Gluconacetobacter johannae DSM 13595]
MADESTGERSQAPTAKRLQTAREEGNVAQSREVQMLVALGAFLLVFTTVTAVTSGRRFVAHMGGIMGHFDSIPPDMASIYGVTLQMGLEGAWFAAPLVLASIAATIMCSLFQTRLLFRPEALIPDIMRLSPIKGFQRIFSLNNMIELLKSIVKFSVFGFLLYGVAQGTLGVAPEAERWTITHLASELVSWFAYATLVVLVVQCVIAVLDTLWTRHDRIRKLRMSFQDIKEEHRQAEGDPKVKGRLQQIRRKRSRQRMIQAAKRATVIVTNPTHYAVALLYENGSGGAPQVVAKGVDELAVRIRHAAEDAKVPTVSNPPLARALYTLPLDSEIPPEYFQPVAAIIAYVTKLKTPGARAPQRT